MDREVQHVAAHAAQAPGFAEKRRALLREAARLYAEHGTAAFSLDRLSVQLGHAHNYHTRYFQTKEQLVYALLSEHLSSLLGALDGADEAAAPRARLQALAAMYLDYALGEGADAHRAFRQIMPWVTPRHRLDLETKQRWLLALFDEAVIAAVPGLAAVPHLVAPLTLSLFAMLNGAMHWLRDGGSGGRVKAGLLRPAEYAALAVGCVVAGAEAEVAAGAASQVGGSTCLEQSDSARRVCDSPVRFRTGLRT